jgi:hypothetical protein
MYRPWLNRGFGIEIEMNDVDTQRRPLSERDFRRVMTPVISPGRLSTREAHYYHSDGLTWDIKLDGSCGLHGYGFEISSPAMRLNEEGECAEMKTVCDAIATLRPRIDRKCGLHVHVDCSDFNWRDVRNLVTLWTRYEPFFYELTPVSRRDNSYCEPFRATRWGQRPHDNFYTVEQAIEATDERVFQNQGARIPRGMSLNISGWWRHGRVEFRLGAGTVNYEKIARWVQLMISVCGRVKNPFLGMPPVFSGQYSERGFTAMYVFKAIGLAASNAVPAAEIPAESVRLLEWAKGRQTQHAEPSRVVPRPRAAPVPSEYTVSRALGEVIDTVVARTGYQPSPRRATW